MEGNLILVKMVIFVYLNEQFAGRGLESRVKNHIVNTAFFDFDLPQMNFIDTYFLSLQFTPS